MELDEIRRAAAAARTFSVVVGTVTFNLRIPTRLESSIVYTRVANFGGERDQASMLRWQRAILLQAVTGWSGARASDVLADLGDSEYLYTPDAVEMLLDSQPEWESKLTSELLDQIAKRKGVEDTAAKN